MTTFDRQTDRRTGDVWLRPIDGVTSPRRIISGAGAARSLRWSPDGSSLAFIAAPPAQKGAAARPQVQVWSLADGTTHQVTNFRNGVSDFSWSPEGGRMACVGSSPTENAATGLKGDARRAVRSRYKGDGGWLDDQRQHLWVVDLRSGAADQITQGDGWNDSDPQWSPDGSSIAFVSDRTGKLFDGSRQADIWVVAAKGGTPRKVSNHDLTGWAETGLSPMHSAPRWSPDGRQVAFLAQKEEDGSRAIWTAQSSGAGDAREVVHEVDVGTKDFIWRRNGYVYASDIRGDRQIFQASPETGHVIPLTRGAHTIDSFDLSSDGSRLVFTQNDFSQPDDIYTAAADGSQAQRLTHTNEALLSQLQLCTVTRIESRGADGVLIDGFLATLPGQSSRKSPMVVFVHGGPSLMFGDRWSFDMQVLCSSGVPVFYINPHGSSGYGSAFVDAIKLEWGGKPYTDLMQALQEVLVKNPWIDARRVGIIGGSYGAYLTDWTIGHTHRFAAAVSIATISDLVSLEGESAAAYGLAPSFGGDLFHNFDLYWKYSPIRTANQVTTPTLLLHGEADGVAPIGQAEEWFQALRHFGVPAEMVVFPRERHSGVIGYQPAHAVQAMQLINDWFARYLGLSSTPDAPQTPK
jgi:dipeptidyl aminopeptidase/acylaminoacyl peptidase